MRSVPPPLGWRATTSPNAGALGFTALVVAATAAMLFTGAAGADDLHAQLSQKRSQLQRDRSRQAALSTTLERYSNQIDQLSGQVAALRERQAAVQQQLDANEVHLRQAEARLERLRTRLQAALRVLRQRLVAIYRSPAPDVITVILDSRGFDDLASRFTYLRRIEDEDSSIAGRARDLRDRTQETVGRIRAAREQLTARRDQLTRTQNELQTREDALAAAHARKQPILARVRSNGEHLQSEISAIQRRIQAAEAAPPPQSTSGLLEPGAPPLTSSLGPVPPGEAISPFPASSPVTWGRTDQGVDGTTTPGSPLLAMGSGTVTIGHDPAGFGASYPIIHTSFGSFYYGHCVPVVADGAGVSIGQPIATAHYGTWGNSTTPGGFEIGAWPPGDMMAGAAIRSWLIGLPRR